MKTQKLQTIGIKEFRQNISIIHKDAQKKKIVYIVMNHQEPVWRVEPIDEDQLLLEVYADQIKEGIKDFKEGRTLTSAQVRKNLGI